MADVFLVYRHLWPGFDQVGVRPEPEGVSRTLHYHQFACDDRKRWVQKERLSFFKISVPWTTSLHRIAAGPPARPPAKSTMARQHQRAWLRALVALLFALVLACATIRGAAAQEVRPPGINRLPGPELLSPTLYPYLPVRPGYGAQDGQQAVPPAWSVPA